MLFSQRMTNALRIFLYYQVLAVKNGFSTLFKSRIKASLNPPLLQPYYLFLTILSCPRWLKKGTYRR